MIEMPGQEALSTVAEVSIGLAGFSGIVVAFIHRKGQMSALDRLRLGVLLVAAFAAVILVLVPFALHHLGIDGDPLWSTASVVMSLLMSMQIAAMLVLIRRFYRSHHEIFNVWVIGPVITTYIGMILLQIMNTSGAFWHPSLGVYYIGLLWLVTHAAIQFTRILFVRPEPQPGVTAPPAPATPSIRDRLRKAKREPRATADE